MVDGDALRVVPRVVRHRALLARVVAQPEEPSEGGGALQLLLRGSGVPGAPPGKARANVRQAARGTADRRLKLGADAPVRGERRRRGGCPKHRRADRHGSVHSRLLHHQTVAASVQTIHF